MSNTQQPTVGQGCHYATGSDIHPATIIVVSPNGRTVVVQDDDVRGKNGRTLYVPNDKNDKRTYTLRSNGRWHLKGESTRSGALVIGERYHRWSREF